MTWWAKALVWAARTLAPYVAEELIAKKKKDQEKVRSLLKQVGKSPEDAA